MRYLTSVPFPWYNVRVSNAHRRGICWFNPNLQRLVRTGAILESKSDFASAVVLVRKRSGALRMCCDFRALNAKTVKDAYPLPRIDESMDALVGARWFSTLDLQSAYTQVPMHPEDQHKIAFTTPFDLYEHRRMAFGLCNAPATFQRLMQTAFREEMFSILLCYLDDVLVFSSTIAEQLQRLDTVFTRLTEYGLKLELKKCAFFQSEVQYLGHRESAAGIATDPEKVAAVERWPRLETLKQLRSFMHAKCRKMYLNVNMYLQVQKLILLRHSLA